MPVPFALALGSNGRSRPPLNRVVSVLEILLCFRGAMWRGVSSRNVIFRARLCRSKKAQRREPGQLKLELYSSPLCIKAVKKTCLFPGVTPAT